MRGKATACPKHDVKLRITPAYAGKSPVVVGICDNKQDHPRLCGEKRQIIRVLFLPAGSPPPMRGKAENACVTDAGNRITPAYAGKSTLYFYRLCIQQDHPRLCGEKICLTLKYSNPSGSPPPMRGKVIVPLRDLADFRITPAYAGKSCCGSRPLYPDRDHPRLCGEKARQNVPSWGVTGSPPPMRGKGDFRRYIQYVSRITPAYAGKSYTSARWYQTA